MHKQTATAITFVVEKLLLDFTMSDNEPHDNIRLDNETEVTNAFFFVQLDLIARGIFGSPVGNDAAARCSLESKYELKFTRESSTPANCVLSPIIHR